MGTVDGMEGVIEAEDDDGMARDGRRAGAWRLEVASERRAEAR